MKTNFKKPKSAEKHAKHLGPLVSGILLGLATYFVLFTLLAAAISPTRYDIQIGRPAPTTIKATKDVDDTVTTQQRRETAVAEVRSIYNVDDSVIQTVQEAIDDKFILLESISLLTPEGEDGLFTEAQLQNINSSIVYPLNLSMAEANSLIGISEETLLSLKTETLTLVTDVLMQKLESANVEIAVASIEDSLSDEFYDQDLTTLATRIVRLCIRPNNFYDEAATEAARETARNSVETITRVKGEVIVSDGEIVTAAQYHMLESLGMVKESMMDITLYYGVALFVLILMGASILYLYLFERDLLHRPKLLLLLSIICVCVISASLLVREVNEYLMPVGLGVLLIAQLLRPRIAMMFNVILSLTVSLFTSSSSGFLTMAMFAMFLNSLLSGPVALYVLRRKQQRLATLLAGAAMGVTYMLTTLAVGLVNNTNMMSVLEMGQWSAASGLLSGILCIGLQPLLEWMFNLVTPAKLLELSNPNSPLLRRLLLEAPGTYHHSIIVANLAEAAAGSVGANGLLARVGAYYHDVGKLKRPSYFKENQLGDNPHDRTDPRVSTAILTAHTRDGAQMAQKAHLPQSIIEIVQSHHGDTPVMYFYGKAVKLYGEENVNIADFRYDGPRPHSREAAIVMLADTIEAAARAMPDPNREKLDELIHRLVRGKMEDSQLDSCELTFADLDRICEAFLTVLSGVFHERIEYPKIAIPKRHNEPDIPPEQDAPDYLDTVVKEALDKDLAEKAAAAANAPQAADEPSPEDPAADSSAAAEGDKV